MNLIAPPSETRIAIDYPYSAKPLLTPSESRFYHCLAALSQGRCLILIKPRLADVFKHDSGEIAALNKISQKHVDFLICRHQDWMPMLGVELDDDSHERKDRKERDMFVNSLFASTGVPLIRIHIREIQQIETLINKLTQAWQQRWTALAQ